MPHLGLSDECLDFFFLFFSLSSERARLECQAEGRDAEMPRLR